MQSTSSGWCALCDNPLKCIFYSCIFYSNTHILRINTPIYPILFGASAWTSLFLSQRLLCSPTKSFQPSSFHHDACASYDASLHQLILLWNRRRSCRVLLLLLPSYYETLRYHHVPPVDPFIGKQEQQQTQSKITTDVSSRLLCCMTSRVKFQFNK